MNNSEIRQKLSDLLDEFRDEVACKTYNGWARRREPDAIRKEIDALVAGLARDGWTAVPEEPTQGMLDALHDAIDHDVQTGVSADNELLVSVLDFNSLPAAYRAMLASVPDRPAAREQGCWCNGSRNCGRPCHPDNEDVGRKPVSAPPKA